MGGNQRGPASSWIGELHPGKVKCFAPTSSDELRERLMTGAGESPVSLTQLPGPCLTPCSVTHQKVIMQRTSCPLVAAAQFFVFS